MLTYTRVEWTPIIRDILKKKGWNQSFLAGRMGTSTSSLTQLLRRGKLSFDSIRKISMALEEDLVVYLLEKDSKDLMNKAIQAGLQDIPLEAVTPELVKDKLSLLRELDSRAESDSIFQEKIDQKTREIEDLEERIRAERHAHELQIARLEAKIEVYRDFRSGGFPPTNLA